MKRTALLKELRQIAKTAGVTIEEREGGRHTHIVINNVLIPVPRHREVAEGTARTIINQAKEATK
jgi:hypothetical protein